MSARRVLIDYTDEFKKRINFLLEVRKNSTLLTATKVVYKNDPAKFIDDWLITYDPQRSPSIIPFKLFPRQIDLIRFFHERNSLREDGICEKCRNVGFTWLAIGYAIWSLLFVPDQAVSFGSRKQDLVDNIGNPDSIFEKIRIALRHLPREFLPTSFNIDEHAPFLRVINPDNNSVIKGESGDNIGRGGRSTIYFLDEAAFIERPLKVEAALSQNSDCKIYISTPNGIGNPFYQKRMSGKFKVFTFNWYDDPRKDKAWFEKMERELDPVIFAQEVLIDYGASLSDVCIPLKWIKAAVNFKMEGLEEGDIRVGLDIADEGDDANAICMRKGFVVKYIDCWKQGNTTQTARKAYNFCRDKNADYLFYDSIGVGAGVKGELSELLLNKEYTLNTVPINVGSTHLPGIYENTTRKNADMFLNLKAQLWWLLRRRFEKTFEHVSKIKQYAPEDLISIPDHSELINELAQPKVLEGENGKLKIEPKKAMKLRGVKSPNIADALVLSFAIKREPSIRIL